MHWAGEPLFRPAPSLPPPTGSSSLRYFYTEVSVPGPGLPAFTTVAYLDDKPLFHYNSDQRRVLPGVPWLEEAVRRIPQFWDRQTQVFEGAEAKFRAGLESLQQTFNQSEGESRREKRGRGSALPAPSCPQEAGWEEPIVADGLVLAAASGSPHQSPATLASAAC